MKHNNIIVTHLQVKQHLTLKSQAEDLTDFAEKLIQSNHLDAKLKILDTHPSVIQFFEKETSLQSYLKTASSEKSYLIKQIIVIGQLDVLIPKRDFFSNEEVGKLQNLLDWLWELDRFYREIGGVVGYQSKMLGLIDSLEKISSVEDVEYHEPAFVDISDPTEKVSEMVKWGIDHLDDLIELYPLGGAADRLHLVDEKTGKDLPAACLKFGHCTLLEILISDLQAREYLHYKLKGKQLTVPIGIMTSVEKNNHQHVVSICKDNSWFHREEKNFCFFTQPLVPTVDKDGKWCMKGPFNPLCKPGGHGIIWKLARDSGVIDGFLKQGMNKALVRQINNPVAGLDYSLLAFTGWGSQHKCTFGFASCERVPGVAEGINVLVEKKTDKRVCYSLSNIEYCDFKRYKNSKDLEDPKKFSSNTNILFADLNALKKAVEKCPLPGMLINLKQVKFFDDDEKLREEKVARLETTMQNIADVFEEEHDKPLDKPTTEKTFLTFNRRNKTIATTKKVYTGGSTLETPERCFWERLKVYRDLFKDLCGIALPELGGIKEYFEKGPGFVIQYHPALGPLFSIIAQKIHGGALQKHSYLSLMIAELEWENVSVDGSLEVEAANIIGHLDSKKLLKYSEHVGRCSLQGVVVRNRGLDWSSCYTDLWKGRVLHKESLKITLQGNAEFHAKDVTLEGNLHFEVPENYAMYVTASPTGGFVITEKQIKQPSWIYQYSYSKNSEIKIQKKSY